MKLRMQREWDEKPASSSLPHAFGYRHACIAFLPGQKCRRDLTGKEGGVLVFMDGGWAVGRENAMGEAVTEEI